MDDSSAGSLVVLTVIVTIGAWIGTGIAAWNWIEPDSFWGGIKFIFAWGLLGYIAQIAAGAIVVGLAHLFEP